MPLTPASTDKEGYKGPKKRTRGKGTRTKKPGIQTTVYPKDGPPMEVTRHPYDPETKKEEIDVPEFE